MQKTKSLHNINIEGCQFSTQLYYNINTNHIGIYTSYRYQINKKTNKTKSLHHIVIKGCNFYTRLHYNINTDHINISTLHEYQDSNKRKQYKKQYNKDNKDKKKEYQKQYNKDNKDKIKEKAKQYWKDNRDPNKTILGSEEHSIMLSCRTREIPIEDFNGFLKEQKYCKKFNDECRKSNRIKYNNKCFICGKDEKNNGRKLSVHHVDMNKQQGCNDTEWKLVPLCQSCHARSHNDIWESRIEYLLECDR
jgi:hypothetical protein